MSKIHLKKFFFWWVSRANLRNFRYWCSKARTGKYYIFIFPMYLYFSHALCGSQLWERSIKRSRWKRKIPKASGENKNSKGIWLLGFSRFLYFFPALRWKIRLGDEENSLPFLKSFQTYRIMSPSLLTKDCYPPQTTARSPLKLAKKKEKNYKNQMKNSKTPVHPCATNWGMLCATAITLKPGTHSRWLRIHFMSFQATTSR